MKVVAVLLLALVCVQADKTLNQWIQFQAEFGKTYRSPVEARRRLSIFQSNLAKIDAHNKLYEQGNVTYNYGINQFADWTAEEFMAYVNKGKINKPKRARRFQKVKINDLELPNSVDWREEGAVTGVKDQGQCGSCWAFSTTGSIEGALQQKSGKLVSLSEQNLIDCSGSYGNNGCEGGIMDYAFQYVKKNGIASEKAYPYIEDDARCHKKFKAVTKISDYVDIDEDDERGLQTAIARNGPISVAIDATAKLQHYKSGVLYDNTCYSDGEALNHGVLAVGYDKSGDESYYIVKNSWGAKWGEKGYFRLPLNNDNACGIAAMASYPVV